MFTLLCQSTRTDWFSRVLIMSLPCITTSGCNDLVLHHPEHSSETIFLPNPPSLYPHSCFHPSQAHLTVFAPSSIQPSIQGHKSIMPPVSVWQVLRSAHEHLGFFAHGCHGLHLSPQPAGLMLARPKAPAMPGVSRRLCEPGTR